MRIRTVLLAAFLTATLVPATIFGAWSYQQGVNREFAEVKDRHLLLAHNVGKALERYHTDLVGTFDSISASLIGGQETPNLDALMSSINLLSVLIVDDASGRVTARAGMSSDEPASGAPQAVVEAARAIAEPGHTTFSQVMAIDDGGNILLGVRRYGGQIAIAVVSTDYFVEIGKAISFGKKGHAAIVDSAGNVLAHPLPEWVASRKNIAKVSSVQRMMNGETGIEQFYSPALKGDMIAGLTVVPGPGWGVMIPQPVDELYEKVYENNRSILLILGISVLITTLFVYLLANSLASPLEELLRVMKVNAKEQRLTNSSATAGFIPITEMAEFDTNYNDMVDRVSEANEKIVAMAFTDSVTGLPNREKFQEQAGRILHGPGGHIGGSLVFVDLDDFKQINDVHGHAVGDEFLRDCADKLVDAVSAGRHYEEPDGPAIARFGGDEFAILMPGLTDTAEIELFLQHLQQVLSTPSGNLTFINKRSASIGCSCYPADGKILEDLLKFADIAMYHAKKAGKNRSQIYSKTIGTMTASELRLEVEKAIQSGHLVLEYQPKISVRENRVAGVEALVRWEHPTLGRIPPDEWVPVISSSPVIERLGEWVIAQAMDDYKFMESAGLDLSIAVNVGSEHFSSAGLIDYLIQVSVEKDFDPGRMEIEITEDALFTSQENAEHIISKLHKCGYKVAIDDFGTGYSNIARLSRLPVDSLKIDRSVVSQTDGNARVASMMECILLMAKKLGCETVAEGVETPGDAERSASYGVDLLQGFHFSESLPADKLIAWAREFDSRPRTQHGGRGIAA